MTCTHGHTIMSPICVTHGELHVPTSTLLSFQYVLPIVSDMYTQAHYYVSSTCHPWWVTCTHEHTTMTPVHVTHGEWHVHMSILPRLQYMPPTMSDVYARAHYHDSSICHPRQVTYMQEHTSKTPVYVTHIEWYICKSTPPCLRYVPPMASGMYARARCLKLRSDNPLVDPPKSLQNPRSTLGESY